MTETNMLPKMLWLYLNIFAIKLALSQTIYSASPTCSYSPASVATVPSYPVSAASSAPTVTVTGTALPASPIASVVSSAAIATIASGSPITVAASPIPVTASPIPVAVSSPIASPVPVSVSPIPTGSPATTEAKAYFVPGPIPDPKVTVLGDIPAVVEVTPKLYPDSSSAFPDPGYIEVKATVCKDGIPSSNIPASKSVLPLKDNSPLAPVKRLTMACANDDFTHKSPFLSNQPVCPGISKMDLLPTSSVNKDISKNPIDFDGLLDGFMTCL